RSIRRATVILRRQTPAAESRSSAWSSRAGIQMFRGVIPILATPFREDEALDLESWRRLLEFMIGIGVDGVTVLGVLGESNRMNDDERRELISSAAATIQGRVPIIVGTSHSGTRGTAYLSRMAEELGASAATAPKIRQLRDALKDRAVTILSGLGALYAPFDLEAGSDGFNTGFAFPEVMRAMVNAARDADWALVHELYSRFAALIVFEQQAGV